MRASFCPRLVNGPFGDPGLYIPFGFKHRAIMFDLGDISALSSKDILKTSHIFVTHTHMDHFAGFDRLLRLMIGRAKKLYLYGPRGFLKNVEGKLAGYTWNLVKNYSESLVLEIAEIHAHKVIRRQYTCMNQFKAQEKPDIAPFNGRLIEESDLTINAAILDHGIPCLGFTLEERFHINIRKNVLASLNLQPGPWLQVLKKSMYDNRDPETRLEAESTQKDKLVTFRLAELIEQIVLITPGQKVSYVADASFNETNIEKILTLVGQSDHLFIEAAFLDKHRDTAKLKNHLTARQAGFLAGRAQVKQLTPFHYSPRYAECGHLLEAEARQAYTASFGSSVAPSTRTT